MLLSVILTTHKRPVLLRRALTSLLSDAPAGVAVVLCADDDDVKTFDTARELLRPSDIFIRLPNHKGPAATRNIGIQVASGTHVCFLDDDDTLDSLYLRALCQLAQEKDQSVRYFDYRVLVEEPNAGTPITLSEDIKFLADHEPWHLEVRNFIPINALLFPKFVFQSATFDENLRSHEDWDLLICLLRAGVSFEFGQGAPGANVHIRQHEGSRNKKTDIALDYLSIYRKWPAQTSEVRALRQEVLAGLALNVPVECL